MQAFLFRFSALAIRFLCPLAALALSSAETMGKYYLFISYFTFVVGISALELAVPFSRKFLRCKSDKQRRLVFSGFLANQVVVTTVLAVPAGVLVSSWAGVPAVLIPLFCLSLATEACVNETGRFFWNIGEWQMPSQRDFIRAAIFAAAIVGSVYFENDVLTAMTFLTIAAGNLCIMGWEWKSWGRGSLQMQIGVPTTPMMRGVWLRVKRSLAGSLPQFAHMQLLGLQPLLERTLVEKTLGLAAVGAFSFFTSFMQSGAGLILVPMVAKVRERLLSVRTINDQADANRQALVLLLRISAVSAACGLMIYVALPLFKSLVGKEFSITPLLALTAYVSSVAAIFCSAISPLLTSKVYFLRANTLSALILMPLFVAQWIYPHADIAMVGVLVIVSIALMQIFGRVLFLMLSTNNIYI